MLRDPRSTYSWLQARQHHSSLMPALAPARITHQFPITMLPIRRQGFCCIFSNFLCHVSRTSLCLFTSRWRNVHSQVHHESADRCCTARRRIIKLQLTLISPGLHSSLLILQHIHIQLTQLNHLHTGRNHSQKLDQPLLLSRYCIINRCCYFWTSLVDSLPRT